MKRKYFNDMEVVICALNTKYIHSSLAPWYLLAAVKESNLQNVKVQVFEGTINQSKEELLAQLLQYKADVLAFSCYIWNISLVKELIAEVKANCPETTIILGGPEVTYNATQLLQTCEGIDYILAGEGEMPFVTLLSALQAGTSIPPETGICYCGNGGVIAAPPYVANEDPPSPYIEEYFNTLNGRIAYAETSRGCPYACTFCLSGACNGLHLFQLERAKKELVLVANSGTQTVKLVDRTFNCNLARTKKLVFFLIAEYGKSIPINICFHFEIEGDIFDEELLNLFATAPAGYFQMEMGIQSFYSKTLKAIQRNPSTEKIKQSVKSLLASRNIHLHIDLIAGLPFETYEEFQNSFNQAYALQADVLQLGFLKVLHGAKLKSEIEEHAEKWSYTATPPYEIIQNEWISKEELQQLHIAEDALERLYNSGRFRESLQYVFAHIQASPYTFFHAFGTYLAENSIAPSVSLDEYTAHFFTFCQTLHGIQKEGLRDIMVVDRLATINTGKLPPALKIEDKRLKQIALQMEHMDGYKQKPGIKRGLAILYSQGKVAFVDYEAKHAVTGRYPVHTIPLSVFGYK